MCYKTTKQYQFLPQILAQIVLLYQFLDEAYMHVYIYIYIYIYIYMYMYIFDHYPTSSDATLYQLYVTCMPHTCTQ